MVTIYGKVVLSPREGLVGIKCSNTQQELSVYSHTKSNRLLSDYF